MSLAIDVLEPSALLIVCQVLDGALLTRLRGVKPGIGSAANVRFCFNSLHLHREFIGYLLLPAQLTGLALMELAPLKNARCRT